MKVYDVIKTAEEIYVEEMNEVYEEGIKEKDIEKAAQEYINSLPLLDDESEVLQIKRAFKAGSKWCITNNK